MAAAATAVASTAATAAATTTTTATTAAAANPCTGVILKRNEYEPLLLYWVIDSQPCVVCLYHFQCLKGHGDEELNY